MLDQKQNKLNDNFDECTQNNYVINTSLLSCSLNNQNSSNKKFSQNKENMSNNIICTENSQNILSFNEPKTLTNNNNPISKLFMAVEYNDLKKASELLKNPQIQLQINDLNEEGISVLHIAVIKANLKMIDLLLSNGADPDILTFAKNQTPLHLAYLNQNSLTEEIIKELLNHHANENILDNKNKKPADYMTSSYKKNKKINNNNLNNGNVDTGNTVTMITMDNHLDSFLTTNKEEDNKSVNNNIMNNTKNINNNGSNNNSIINNSNIQTPIKIYSEGELYCNEVISQKKSEEKNKKNVSNNVYNIIQNNDMGDGNENNRRQYTFGKEEDYLKFQRKNFAEDIDTKNLQNNSEYYMKFGKNIDISEKNKISNENLKDIDNSLFCSEEKNQNNQNLIPTENENSEEYNEANNNEEHDKYNDSLENIEVSKSNNRNNLLNNNQDNSMFTNSILTYSNSCIRSKIKASPNEKQNHINEINNIDDVNRNAKTINVNLDKDFIKNFNNNYIKDNDEFFFKKIIQQKRDSVKKNSENKLRKRFSSNLCENQCQRFSTNKTNSFDINNNSIKSNKVRFISPIFTISENDNNNLNKCTMKNKENLNTNNNNSYRNNTVIHNVDTQPQIHGFSNSNNTQYSTQSQNIKNKFGSKDKIKVIMDQNIENKNLDNIPEFYYIDNNNNVFTRNYSHSNVYSNTNEEEIFAKSAYLKFWLNNLGLINYYQNFASNSIYDIYKLVNQMKSYETKLKYEDFDNYLKIRVPGHVYRILCRLEADAGLIDNKIIKFMLRDGLIDPKNIYVNNGVGNSSDPLKLSISQEYQCLNCCRINSNKKVNRKNDLKSFLRRYGILNMYQNFYHNGFEMIEYVILQMYSSMPINDEILENHFHIYDEKLRSTVLKSIVYEMKKINEFLNSEEYNNFIEKDKIKYENVAFVSGEEGSNDKIGIQNNGSDNGCHIY